MNLLKPVSVALCVVLMGFPALAQSVKLKAHEIEALLSGNTAIGKWEGIPYRQYFAPDGTTIYTQLGSRTELGEWRIDIDKDEYQNIWPRDAAWEGWYVMEYAGAFYWVSKATPPTPFRVEEGQKHVASATDKGFCAELDQFIAPEHGIEETLDLITLPVSASPEPTCSRSIALSGQASRHCYWLFEYRSDDASDAFETTVEAVSGCLNTQQTAQTEPSVNHPDSYDLRAFNVEGGTLSVSIKDKGSLQKTAIFLRMETASQ
jgi:hypothetical protein